MYVCMCVWHSLTHLNINIRLLPCLELETLPLHFALGAVGSEATPSFERAVGDHFDLDL